MKILVLGKNPQETADRFLSANLSNGAKWVTHIWNDGDTDEDFSYPEIVAITLGGNRRSIVEHKVDASLQNSCYVQVLPGTDTIVSYGVRTGMHPVFKTIVYNPLQTPKVSDPTKGKVLVDGEDNLHDSLTMEEIDWDGMFDEANRRVAESWARFRTVVGSVTTLKEIKDTPDDEVGNLLDTVISRISESLVKDLTHYESTSRAAAVVTISGRLRKPLRNGTPPGEVRDLFVKLMTAEFKYPTIADAVASLLDGAIIDDTVYLIKDNLAPDEVTCDDQDDVAYVTKGDFLELPKLQNSTVPVHVFNAELFSTDFL